MSEIKAESAQNQAAEAKALEVIFQPVTCIKGISVKRQEKLHKLDIYTVMDLICHYPRRYEDWTEIKNIIELEDDSKGIFLARVESRPSLYRRGNKSILNLTVRDDTAVMRITWFNQAYFQDKFAVGKIYLFRGKIKRRGLKFETVNPKFSLTNLQRFPQSEEEWEAVSKNGFVEAVYPSTQGISQNDLRKWIKSALDLLLPALKEYLPHEVRQKYKLASLTWSFEQIHNPEQEENYLIARRRLAFDELLFLQLNVLLSKEQSIRQKGVKIDLNGNSSKLAAWHKLIDALAFELTNDQKQSLNDILQDMAKDVAMHRLIQGDVGSGKTIVAFLAMVWAGLNGYQSVLMVPTAILARQHYESFRNFFKTCPQEQIALLTGELSQKEKTDIYQRLAAGEIKYLIGTHAVLEDKVQFKNLALAVTDEQHRFGVKQRMQLSSGTAANVLVMSATPIPRTLTLLLYGDLDISNIREKPAGRKEVKTYTARSKDIERLLDLLRRNTASGGQSYVVCPTVEQSDSLDLSSVHETYKFLQTRLKGIEVGLLHGQMPDEEKAEIYAAYLKGEIKVLVATTVIEVGVDNPNASLMIIVNAERFGLATLHQLRGRVGRGSRDSLCVLLSNTDSTKARERLVSLCKTSDGFAIAEADLNLRGPGDIFGTRQHGIPALKIANLYEDMDLIQASSTLAKEILTADPSLEADEHQILQVYLKNARRGVEDA